VPSRQGDTGGERGGVDALLWSGHIMATATVTRREKVGDIGLTRERYFAAATPDARRRQQGTRKL
jgi:hypothetical protein